MSREKMDDSEAAAARVAEAARAEMRAAREVGPDGRALRIALARTEAEAEAPARTTEAGSRRGRWALATAGAGTLLAAAGLAGLALLALLPRTPPAPMAPPALAVATPAPSPSPSALPVTAPLRSAPVAEPPRRIAPRWASVGRPTAVRNAVAATEDATPAPRRTQDPTPRVVAAANVPNAPAAADDLEAINGGALDAFARRWTRLACADAARLEADLLASVKGGDDFVEVPLPRLAGRGSAGAADAVRAYKGEREVVDPRLQRKVTLAVKGASFAELCEELSRQTGIRIDAGRRVADDNVTVFCKARPARDLMRAVARLFGFAWERKGAEGEWTYRLNQPLRAQLLEEELRDRDRHEALVALDREMGRYERFLDLSPADARAAAKTAGDGEKALLENLGGEGWAPARLYGMLTPEQLSALHAGQKLGFNLDPARSTGGDYSPAQRRAMGWPDVVAQLDPAWAGSIVDSLDSWRVKAEANGGTRFSRHTGLGPGPEGVPPSQVPGVRAHQAELEIVQKELGVLALNGSSAFLTKGGGGTSRTELAVGVSPSVADPKNAQVNAALQGTPGMTEKVSIVPEPVTTATGRKDLITAAEALEAFHRATGRDVIGDQFTRLRPRAQGTVKEASLFDALCRVGDALRLRWGREDCWLTFRSVSFFNDRPKEVPRRLLVSWQQARRTAGGLPLDDLLQIAALSDAQLDSADIAQGAEHLYGIAEWEQVRNSGLRPHWRILAALPPGARESALSTQGLPFGGMPWEVQERVTAQVVPTGSKPVRFAEVYAGLLLRARFAPAVEADKKRMEAEFTYTYPGPGGTRYRQQVGTDGGTSYGPEPPPTPAAK